MNDTSNVQAVNSAQPSVNASNTGVAPAAPVNNNTASAPVAPAPAPAPAVASAPASVVTNNAPVASPAPASAPAPVVPAPAAASEISNTAETEKKVEEQPNDNNPEDDDDDDYAVGGNRKIPIVLSLTFVGLMAILGVYYYVFFTAERVFTKIVEAAKVEVEKYVETVDLSTIGKKQLKFNATATIPGMEFESVTGQSYSAVLSADIQNGIYGFDVVGTLSNEEILNAHFYNSNGSLYAKLDDESTEVLKLDHNYDFSIGNDKTKLENMLYLATTFVDYAFFDEGSASNRTISRTIYRDKVADQTLTGLKTTFSITEEQFVVLMKDFAGKYATVTEFINPLANILGVDATELTHKFNRIASDYSDGHNIKLEFFTNLATTKVFGVGLQIDEHYFKFNNLYEMIFVNYTYSNVNEDNEDFSISVDFNINPYEKYEETTTITLANAYMYVQKGIEVKYKTVNALNPTSVINATKVTFKNGLVKEDKDKEETKKETLIDFYGYDATDKAFTSLGLNYTYNNDVKDLGIIIPENGTEASSLNDFIKLLKNNQMIKDYLETNNVLIICMFKNEGVSMQPGEMPSGVGGGFGMMGGTTIPGADPNSGGMMPGGDPGAMGGTTTAPNTGQTNVGGVQVQPGGATTAPNTGETNVGGVQVQPGTGATQPSGTPPAGNVPSNGAPQTGTVPGGTPPAGMPPA